MDAYPCFWLGLVGWDKFSKMIAASAYDPSLKLITNMLATGPQNCAGDMDKGIELRWLCQDQWICDANTDRCPFPYFVFFLLFFFKHKVSCIPDWSLTGCTVGDDLELLSLLPLPPECWVVYSALTRFSVVMGIKTRTSFSLGTLLTKMHLHETTG